MPTPIYEINRKHTINSAYFNDIKTEHQAYWLGFIWADGSISKTAKRCSGYNRLTISQKETERIHLEKLAKELNSSANLTEYEPYPNKKIVNLSINCRPLCQQLEQLGYGTKDKRIHIPPIPNYLIRHFIRGYFDGDGCLSIYQQKTKQWLVNRQEWSLTGNPIFIKEIQTILNQETTVSQSVRLKSYKNTNKAISLRYGRKSDIDALYHYLYDNCTVYLNSKHQRFIDFYSRQSKSGLQSNALRI